MLFGNFVETLLSDGLPKGAGCLKCLFLQSQLPPNLINKIVFPACARLLPAFGGKTLRHGLNSPLARMVMSCGHWLTISIICPIGCDNAPASGKAAIRADNFTVILSNRGLGPAMVGYVYNLGIKKRYNCMLDSRIQTNSRQNKESIPLLH